MHPRVRLSSKATAGPCAPVRTQSVRRLPRVSIPAIAVSSWEREKHSAFYGVPPVSRALHTLDLSEDTWQ